MIYGTGESKALTRNVEVPVFNRKRFSVSDDEILTLSDYALIIEEHYSAKSGKPVPMDIEWAKDGITGELFVVQARPETVQSQRDTKVLEKYILDGDGAVIVKGKSVGEKIASGKARVVLNIDDLHSVMPGEIIVANTTTPDWEPVMKASGGVLTNRGGRTCHAAIVSRELGIPAIVGAENATRNIETGQYVTLNCAQGTEGIVYEGAIDFHIEKVDLGNLKRPSTKIMMNLANPDLAFFLSMIPNDGVGLARMEFIITNYIKMHPMALLHTETCHCANE